MLLTQHALSDPFIVEYIDDLRTETGNQLVTAEQVDLASLHSIRTFATKWIDNAPPRRLDVVILCASTLTPRGSEIKSTAGEGVEVNWMVNYLANFHLLSILSPALRAQPPDRDVRILFGTCNSYMAGDLSHITSNSPPQPTKKPSKRAPNSKPASPGTFSPSNAHATSKLALTTFALAFQKHLSSYKRPDNFPPNSKVLLVDPGMCRTPGTRRYLTFGSLVGLLLYLLFYPIWWMVLKSPTAGAQSFLFAAMEERFTRSEGGVLIKECDERGLGWVEECLDEECQRLLWGYSEQMVQEAEKRGAAFRAKGKKEKEERKEEVVAEEEVREYKEKVGKKEGGKKEGSRRSRKVG